MMSIVSFLQSLVVLLAVMAVLAIVETAVPFSRQNWRRRHAVPNLVLSGSTLALNFILNAGIVLVPLSLVSPGSGLLAGAGLTPAVGIALGILALDASTYFCHRSMHRVPALWRAHRVHHSDPLVDVTTTLRFHPIETMWRFVFIVAPAIVLGIPAETVAIYRALSAIVGLIEHANVRFWLPLDSALSLVVGTPNMHKIHHSRLPSETNTNYGNIFSFFDRVFGTFTPSVRATHVKYGLEGLDNPETQRLGSLLHLAFRPDPRVLDTRYTPPFVEKTPARLHENGPGRAQ